MNLNRITTFVASLAAALITTTAFAKEGDEQGKGGAPGVPKDFPLTKCVVSGEKLGEHGKPVKVTSEGTDVWLCCKSCIKDFNKESAKFVKMIKDAQPKKYPRTCKPRRPVFPVKWTTGRRWPAGAAPTTCPDFSHSPSL